MTWSFFCVQAVDFLSQVLDSPELEAIKDAVQNLQDIGESFTIICGMCFSVQMCLKL